MSADVAEVIRTSGSVLQDLQLSHLSSTQRLLEEKKTPPGSHRRRRRRRSECTENGSIGYGSCAPIESQEASYSSHPGYPPRGPCSGSDSGPVSGSGSGSGSGLTADVEAEKRSSDAQSSLPPLLTTSMKTLSLSSSAPSSGAYVDVSSSTKIASSTNSKPPRHSLTRNTTNATSVGPSTSSWNTSSVEQENDYVVDTEKGNAYYKGQFLGKGGFAKVYLMTDMRTKKQYACKIIPKNRMQKIHMQKIAREIMIHKELNHVNIVQMHHYFEDNLHVYMLLEACPRKSLMHVLKYRGKVTEPEARYYMKQMVTGVAYIHSQNVVHRDLKPGNMFLSERMIVKIGDFGLATRPDGQRRRVTICGTPNYIAPEVLFKQAYSYEADVWALGCILYALLVGQPPFDTATLKETYARICSLRYKHVDDTIATRSGQELIRWLLQPNPDLRPTLEVVKNHPYLTKEYVPSSLPDTCCYQAPRLSIISRPAALPSLASNISFGHTLAPLNGPPENSQSLPAKQQVKQKKKVSSWIVRKLPKLPRFRQRLNNVFCPKSRKKQALTAGDGNGGGPQDVPQSVLMTDALDECLLAMRLNNVRATTNPPLVEDFVPIFVTKWIDYSNKYGLGFQLSDRSVGVLFNDSTKMSYTHDRRRVEYLATDDEVTRYNKEKDVPAHLEKKLDLLQRFAAYMDYHLTEGGEISEQREVQPSAKTSKNACVPRMRRWLRTSKVIVMELTVPLLQMNFFSDHTKLIVSQEPTGRGYLVTYIDGGRHPSSYWLNDLRDFGCTAELLERLRYVCKVSREFAALDTNTAAPVETRA